MDKNDIIKKIKFMEMALEQEEKINLLCRPSYDCWGGFNGLELFFISENMTEHSILNENNYFVVLKHSDIDRKKTDMRSYISSFCKCDLDEVENCTCKMPSKEEAEEHWYNSLIEKLEERSKEIKANLK